MSRGMTCLGSGQDEDDCEWLKCKAPGQESNVGYTPSEDCIDVRR